MRPCGVRYFRPSGEHTATAPCSVLAVKIRGLRTYPGSCDSSWSVVGTSAVGTDSSGGSVQLTHMLIAVTAMFLQQTCGSIARALPAVLAPLIIAELHADAAWVG